MAKVSFKRVESINDLNSIDIEDGNFIITGDSNAFIDYGSKRIPIGGTPDNQMDDSSTNSVQNKIIKKYIDDKTSTNSKDIEELKESNIYSTEEKVIGKWIDGKPIYRKVSNVTLQNESNWTNLISIPNLDKLINAYGFCRNIMIPRYESSSYYTQFLFENNYLKYMSSGNSGSAFIVTEYTKTTDEVSE